MGWVETVRTALGALNARRTRSLLTVLGILIGISAVMLTVGLGQGAQIAITNQINSLGSNLIIVTPSAGSSSSGFRGGGASSRNSASLSASIGPSSACYSSDQSASRPTFWYCIAIIASRSCRLR